MDRPSHAGRPLAGSVWSAGFTSTFMPMLWQPHKVIDITRKSMWFAPFSQDDHGRQGGIVSPANIIRSLDTHTNDALSPIIIGTKRSLLQKLLTEAQSHVAQQFIRPVRGLRISWQ